MLHLIHEDLITVDLLVDLLSITILIIVGSLEVLLQLLTIFEVLSRLLSVLSLNLSNLLCSL